MQNSRGAVHVAAAERDYPLSGAPKNIHGGLGLGAAGENKVDHDFGREVAKLAAGHSQVAPISQDLVNAVRQVVLGWPWPSEIRTTERPMNPVPPMSRSRIFLTISKGRQDQYFPAFFSAASMVASGSSSDNGASSSGTAP